MPSRSLIGNQLKLKYEKAVKVKDQGKRLRARKSKDKYKVGNGKVVTPKQYVEYNVVFETVVYKL